MRIEQSVAIVTGASSGLGAATAQALSEQGAQVVMADRDSERGTVVAKKIRASFVTADVADEEQVNAAIERGIGNWAASDPGQLCWYGTGSANGVQRRQTLRFEAIRACHPSQSHR